MSEISIEKQLDENLEDFITTPTESSAFSDEVIGLVGELVAGVVSGAKQLASPNFNLRPQGEKLSLLVIHNISLPPAKFGTNHVEDFFLNQLRVEDDPFFTQIEQLKVSAHLFIKRNGQITQFVNLNQRAWHAGVSSFEGRQGCNDFSIGIELEGTDDIPYEKIQYQVLARLSVLIARSYPLISPQNTCGHDAIAPGRKTDPGEAFDWSFYRQLWDEYQ